MSEPPLVVSRIPYTLVPMSLNTVAMHRVSPRRSACDRCRSHKLRCVRLGPNQNATSATGNPDSLMPCQRCLKAGTECVATAHLSGKPTGENHPVHHISTAPGHSASPYQQRTPGTDRPLKDFAIDISPQSNPQAKRRKNSGPRPGKDASPPWAPTPMVTPPASDKARSSHAPSFDMDKIGLESREFGPLSSLLHDSTGASTHMLHYPPAEPLVSSSYFGASANIMVGQNLREQPMDLSGPTTDDCLHRLSQLSSNLLMDFGKASSSNMGDPVAFLSLHGGASTWHPDGANYLSNTVSKLFESLQVFLDTVERLRPNPTISSSASECSYSDQWDESEFVSTTDDGQLYHNTITVDQIHVPSDTNHGAAESASSHASENSKPFDMPATLTILTCYTWLLKGYEMVLTGIKETLASHDRLQGLKSLPPIFHGPGIGCLSLEDHPDMQIEIVIHIGSQLLHRIEGVLGIHVVSEGRDIQDGHADRRGILDTNSAAALLDIWMAKGNNGDKNPGDPCGGTRIHIKQTVDNIRRLLREYWRDFQGK
ncbi:hypothetical protein F5Y01DRAFT_278294 [Xylaria sp. FL0043]|nr:hypothetical protein F5Y01DRAFT_278294 [Xylaria sp. FL0043]